ncbi:hypothetical protein GJ496_009578 [Pomphorhynchus laevis]|nr:hypothetical protein GJ496_009578 [Pomphorhynchus laevis]
MLHSNDYKERECLEEASIRFIRSKYIDCCNRQSRRDQRPSRFKLARYQFRQPNNQLQSIFNEDLTKLNLSPVRLADDVIVNVPL